MYLIFFFFLIFFARRETGWNDAGIESKQENKEVEFRDTRSVSKASANMTVVFESWIKFYDRFPATLEPTGPTLIYRGYRAV